MENEHALDEIAYTFIRCDAGAIGPQGQLAEIREILLQANYTEDDLTWHPDEENPDGDRHGHE